MAHSTLTIGSVEIFDGAVKAMVEEGLVSHG